jgi:hypothetical protein
MRIIGHGIDMGIEARIEGYLKSRQRHNQDMRGQMKA